jgi:ketosteroid isomerase-like protein
MSHKARSEALRRAVTLTVGIDPAVPDEIFSENASFWANGSQVMGRGEYARELVSRDEFLTDLKVDIAALHVVEDRGYAEWLATATHSGALVVDDELTIDATGAPITIRGITVADFEGDRIAALRQYWDEVAFLEAISLLPVD